MIPKDQEGGGVSSSVRAQRSVHCDYSMPMEQFCSAFEGRRRHTGFLIPGFRQEYGPLTARVSASRLLLFFSTVKAILSPRAKPIFGGHMLKKMLTLLCALVFSMSMLAFQDTKEG